MTPLSPNYGLMLAQQGMGDAAIPAWKQALLEKKRKEEQVELVRVNT